MSATDCIEMDRLAAIPEDKLTDPQARRLHELSLRYSEERERPSSWESEFYGADPDASVRDGAW